MSSLQDIYQEHHGSKREKGFSILETDRGELLKTIIGTGKTALDIGCRDGALTKWFVEGNQVLGVDIDANALHRASEGLGIATKVVDLNADWKELGDEKFDVVVAGEVLEHLYYPEKVAEIVRKHLNPGGMFLGSVPNAFSLKNRARYLLGRRRFTPLEDPTHITQFNVEELTRVLSKSFGNVEIVGLGKYKKLAKFNPGWFGFDLFFIAK